MSLTRVAPSKIGIRTVYSGGEGGSEVVLGEDARRGAPASDGIVERGDRVYPGGCGPKSKSGDRFLRPYRAIMNNS